MRGRRALRFVVEALFLGALAAALCLAELSAPAIAGAMLLGWLVVALFEWAATRELPHYGRGLPPRYYVPQISLPPPRPLEQLPSGYPVAEVFDEEPTWIASPAMRAEMLAEWPVAAGTAPSPGEETVVDELLFVAVADEYREDTWPDLEAAEREGGWEAEPVRAVVEDVPDVVAEEPDIGEDVKLEPVAVATPELVEEPERPPESEVLAVPEPMAEVVADPEVIAEPEVEAVVVADPEVIAEREVVEEAAPETAPAPERLARHTFDPLAKEGPARRPWRRRSAGDETFAEVPALPPRPGRLPDRSRRDD